MHGCVRGVHGHTIPAPLAATPTPARPELVLGMRQTPTPRAVGGSARRTGGDPRAAGRYARRPGGGSFGVSLSLAISHIKGSARFAHLSEIWPKTCCCVFWLVDRFYKKWADVHQNQHSPKGGPHHWPKIWHVDLEWVCKPKMGKIGKT